MKTSYIILLPLFILLSANTINAQHCGEATVPNNTEFAKLQDGMGFLGSYALSCIPRGAYTEVQVPLKNFRLIKKLNNDDTVYAMRIESINNIPAGMCWVTNKADNTFGPGEGGSLIIRGITNDKAGQYNLTLTVSFDVTGSGEFTRANVNYNTISKSGRMILRVTDKGADCPKIDYSDPGNVAGFETSAGSED